MDDQDNKTQSTTSQPTKPSTSDTAAQPQKVFTLMKMTGQETDEELHAMAEQMTAKMKEIINR